MDQANHRVVAWFSHGAASAVATKMALAKYGDRVVIACIDTSSEHPDNERFRSECEAWFSQPIVMLHSDEYADIYDVFDRTGYLVGPAGARCTTELKKRVRYAFECPDDLHVWGYTADEKARAARFVEQNPGVASWFPLLDEGLTKGDCLALIERAGIALPEMYRLGYRNNNCLGCVKGGMGYWNKLRVDFPEVFDRMARQERKMGRTVLREQVNDGMGYWAMSDAGGEVFRQTKKSVPVWLDELDPERGRYEAEDIACGPVCETVEREWQPVAIRPRVR